MVLMNLTLLKFMILFLILLIMIPLMIKNIKIKAKIKSLNILMKMKKINETNVDETNNSFIKKIKRNEEIK